MAEVKWVKIVTDIFDDEKMLLIDGLPEHDAIIVIWFKLLCLAGKQNNGGVFMISNKIAFTDEMLATIFHRPLNTVRLALNVFEKYRMFEIVDDTITIPNWSKHQSLDSYERKKENDRLRQAKKRELQRALIAEKSTCCRVTSRDMSRDITHIEIDKNKNRKEVEEDNTTLSASQAECPFSEIRDLYHQICVSYPTIRAIDGNRRKAVAARWRTYKSLDTFEELFRLAEASSFLKGENERNWFADFDWMMKPTNFTKILEHKYEERQADEAASRKSTACHGESPPESESNPKSNRESMRAAHFTPPTVEEVKAYCEERQNNVDAECFVDFYTSKGWKVGKDSMQDWQAAVRTWERNRVDKPKTSVKQENKYCEEPEPFDWSFMSG